MKKFMKLIAIIIIVSTLAGCNQKKTIEQKKENENQIIDISNIDEENIKDTNECTDDKSNTITYRLVASDEKEYSVIIAKDKNDKALWSYKTEEVGVAQWSVNAYIGCNNNKLYTKEENVIVVFDTTNGNITKKIENIVGNDPQIVFANNMYTFVATNRGMTGFEKIYVLDNNDKVVKTIDCPEDYMIYADETNGDTIIFNINKNDSDKEKSYEINYKKILENDWSFSKIIK